MCLNINEDFIIFPSGFYNCLCGLCANHSLLIHSSCCTYSDLSDSNHSLGLLKLPNKILSFCHGMSGSPVSPCLFFGLLIKDNFYQYNQMVIPLKLLVSIYCGFFSDSKINTFIIEDLENTKIQKKQ